MKRILILLIITVMYNTVVIGQFQTENLTIQKTGDITVNLGKHLLGTTIQINIRVSGHYAEVAGTYQIVADWNSIPRVVMSYECPRILNRIKFYAYNDGTSNAYLYATWDNQSPEDRINYLYMTINSTSSFDLNNTGNFSNAQILNETFIVKSNGKIGVGTKTTGNHTLAVEGSIGAREVQVESKEWADFVFEDQYELKSINELEKYISENKRLPDIPSALEVEEYGINLGEMDAKLLRKIEELTLYIIQQNKRIDKIERENKLIFKE